MTRRLLLTLFAIEFTFALGIGAYSLFPIRLALLGRIANGAFASLPLLVFGAVVALLFAVFLGRRLKSSPPAQTEDSRILSNFRDRIRVNPSTYNLFHLASFCQKTSRYDAAVEHFREVLALEPDRLPARYGLGISLFRTGHVDEAIEKLEAVFQEDIAHDYGQIEIRLAEAYLRRNEPDKALKTLDQRRACLGIAEFHFLRGQALEKLGCPKEARTQHLLVLEAAASSPAHRKEKDRHLAQLARQFLVRDKTDQPSAQ